MRFALGIGLGADGRQFLAHLVKLSGDSLAGFLLVGQRPACLVCVLVGAVKFGAQLAGPGLGRGGPLTGRCQLLANGGEFLGQLFGGGLLSGQLGRGRLQLAGLALESLGQLLPHRVQLGPLCFPCGLCAAQGFVRQLLGLLPDRRHGGAAGLLHDLRHRHGHRGGLGSLRPAPFLHHGAGCVHIYAGGPAHRIDRGHRLAARLLEKISGGGNDALAHVGGDLGGLRCHGIGSGG
ncbi:hypothetical protein FEP83_05626 [Burkholderia multivorans]|nr:hypothetical protein [Burkholderia multivorans]